MKKSIFLFFAAILCATSAWGVDTFKDGQYIYYQIAGNSNWTQATYVPMFGWYWDSGNWCDKELGKEVPGTDKAYYYQIVPNAYIGYVQIMRMNGNNTSEEWNYSNKKGVPADKTQNCYYFKSASWSGGDLSIKTYAPPMSSVTLADNGTSIVGGTGTQADPYLVYVESAIKVKATGTKAVDDPDAIVNYDFKENSTSKQNGTGTTYEFEASSTVGTGYAINLDGYTKVSTTAGDKKAAATLYYKTIAVPVEETHDVTVSYKCGTTFIEEDQVITNIGITATRNITAPDITGYTFANWTLGAGVATEDELTANPISITTKSGEIDYNLTANYEKIQLTYNVTVPAGSKGCYIAGDMNSWSFTEMTKVDDTHYTITIDGATADQTYKYASSGEWKYVEVKEDGGDVDNRTYSENDVVAKWKAMPGVYLAGGMNGWNTTANEFVDGTLSIDLAASSTIEFKIVKDGDWLGNGEEIKADNCENVSIGTGGNNCKIVTGVAGSYTFTWDNTNTQLSVTYPAGVAEDVYTIVGAATLVGSEWNTSDTNNDMEKQSDGSYKLVKEDVVLAVGTYDYKVIKNHSYDWSIPEGNSNQQLPISTSAKYDVTFVLSSDLTTLTATATFIESVDVTPDCYLSGNEALTGQDWGTHDELKMTYESSTETYSITLNNLAAATAFEMKVVYNGSWLGFDNLATTPDGVKNSGGNISFQLAAEGSLTVTYNVTNGITLTGNFYVPDYSNQPNIIYFHPSTEWKKDGARFAAYFFDAESKWISMTDNDGDGVYEVANEKKNEKVIFCSMTPDNLTNDWEQKIHQTQDLTIPNTADDPNICYAFWQNSLESNDGTWVAPTPLTADNYETIISTYGGKTVNIVVERQFADAEWHTICLPFTYAANWFGTAYQLGSLIANGVEGITITTKECTNIEAGKPYLLKPNKIEEYDHVILSDVQVPTSVSAGTNSVTGAGYTVTLTANLKTNGTTTTEYWIGNGGYLYNDAVSKLGLRSYFTIPPVSSGMPPRFRVVTGENEATGIEDIITTDTPVKVIENGQLIIIRNGEKFNVQGQKL